MPLDFGWKVCKVLLCNVSCCKMQCATGNSLIVDYPLKIGRTIVPVRKLFACAQINLFLVGFSFVLDIIFRNNFPGAVANYLS